MKLSKFCNFTDEIFAHPSLGGHDELCQWGKEPYCFPAKSSQVMEDWKAAFFAKHLTNRELLKQPQGEYHTSPKQKDDGSVDDQIFLEIYNKCYLPMDMPEQSPEKLKDSLIQEEIKSAEVKTIQEEIKENIKSNAWCKNCDSKGGRHRKGCPSLLEVKPNVESQFEGLK